MGTQPAGGPPGGVAGAPGVTHPTPPKKKAGRKREDGLVTGSAEAEAADRERDRLRKERERAMADPAPLPSAGATNGDQAGPAPADPAAGPGDGQSLPVVPWEAKEFAPWIEKVFDGAEKSRMAKREFRAREAGFSDPSIRKIVNDARYNGPSRQALTESSAEGMAWGANKLSLSRGAVKGGLGLIALVTFFLENRRSDAEFEKLLAEMKKGKPPEEKA